jgi:hypothetical protein
MAPIYYKPFRSKNLFASLQRKWIELSITKWRSCTVLLPNLAGTRLCKYDRLIHFGLFTDTSILYVLSIYLTTFPAGQNILFQILNSKDVGEKSCGLNCYANLEFALRDKVKVPIRKPSQNNRSCIRVLGPASRSTNRSLTTAGDLRMLCYNCRQVIPLWKPAWKSSCRGLF